MEICIQTGDVIDVLGFEKGYATLKEIGFTAIDWNLDHAWKSRDIYQGTYLGKSIMEQPLDQIIAYYAEELAVIKKNGLKISQAHAPFPAYVPGHPEVLEYAIEVYKNNIKFCDYAGCKNLVIHGISLNDSDKENTAEDIERLNMQLYEALIPTLLECNVTVCLENDFIDEKRIAEGICSDANQAVRFIDALNEKAGREVFGFCLDTGHLNLLRKNFRTFIPVLGKRIKALHIHDNDGVKDLHMAPLTGTINWIEFCQELSAVGYEGDLDFETFNQTNKVMRTDMDLLMPWLKVIYQTGNIFRKKIRK